MHGWAPLRAINTWVRDFSNSVIRLPQAEEESGRVSQGSEQVDSFENLANFTFCSIIHVFVLTLKQCFNQLSKRRGWLSQDWFWTRHTLWPQAKLTGFSVKVLSLSPPTPLSREAVTLLVATIEDCWIKEG